MPSPKSWRKLPRMCSRKSAATGEKVHLEVLSRTYGRGASLMVQMQVLREVKKLAPKPKPNAPRATTPPR